MAYGSQRQPAQMQCAELRTDGVQVFQTSISAYKKAGFPSQVNVQCFLKVIIKIWMVTFYCISSVSGLIIRKR